MAHRETPYQELPLPGTFAARPVISSEYSIPEQSGGATPELLFTDEVAEVPNSIIRVQQGICNLALEDIVAGGEL